MAANLAKAWTFSQLGGAQKTMTLLGWNAPFGRPRKGAVVNAGLSVRRSVTYYPAKNMPPTIHSFGSQGKPFELHGRWMDAPNGKDGTVQQMVRDWKDFIADELEVRAKWGDILSYRIFIHDFDAGMESEADVAWKLEADVILDEAAPIVVDPFAAKSPTDYASQLGAMFSDVQKPFQLPQTVNVLALLPEISDAFDAILTTLNAPFAAVYDTASALSDFETALSSDLVKMGSGLQTMRSGVLQLRETSTLFASRAASMNVPGAFVEGTLFSAPDMLAILDAKTTSDVATTNLLALIAEMQNDMDRTSRGQATAAHAAQDGDTWETIATRTLGSPDGARAIKHMNSIRYGKRPQPGKVYILPRTQ